MNRNFLIPKAGVVILLVSMVPGLVALAMLFVENAPGVAL